jgi:hypothetical protein
MWRKLPLMISILSIAWGIPVAVHASPRVKSSTCFLDVLKQSFPVAAIKEVSGVPSSTFKYLMHTKSEGKFYPELSEFFSVPKKLQPIAILPNDAAKTLIQIDSELSNHERFPIYRLQNKGMFDQWNEVSKTIAKSSGSPEEAISDFVVFRKDKQIAFAKKDGHLIPIEINSNSNPITLQPEQKVRIEVSNSDSDLTEELLVREYAEKTTGAEKFKIRKMSPVTNDMRYSRDRTFEWEGELIANMRSKGARTVPNIQELIRASGRQGIAVDHFGTVSVDPKIEAALKKAYELSYPNAKDGFKDAIDKFAERQVYHTLMHRYLDENPALVKSFLTSDAYTNLAEEFVNVHASYIGATQFDIAKGMLAEMKLYEFEKQFHGVTSPALSESQRYLAAVPHYHEQMEAWLKSQTISTPNDIKALSAKLNGVQPFSLDHASTTLDVETLVKKAEVSIKTVKGQLDRHITHNKLTRLAQKAGLITDTKQSFPNNLIANVGMANVEGESRYAVSAYMNPARADGYFGPPLQNYHELPVFTVHPGEVSKQEANQMMLEIVRSPNFDAQIKKIEIYAPKLSKYLSTGEGVPETVKEFAKTLYGDAFAPTVYKKLGVVYDPNTFNRFFPDGSRDFQKMHMYRYLFDLAHGETSVLIKNTMSKPQYLQRVFMSKWKPYAFEKVTADKAQNALDEVLETGSNRIKRLRHEAVDAPKMPVDIREECEVAMTWDAYNMKFQRWATHWDEWDAMGGGWNCVCFMRKSIFNPYSIRQF